MTAEGIVMFFFFFSPLNAMRKREGANKTKPHCFLLQYSLAGIFSHCVRSEFNEVSDSAAHCAAACGVCCGSTAVSSRTTNRDETLLLTPTGSSLPNDRKLFVAHYVYLKNDQTNKKDPPSLCNEASLPRTGGWFFCIHFEKLPSEHTLRLVSEASLSSRGVDSMFKFTFQRRHQLSASACHRFPCSLELRPQLVWVCQVRDSDLLRKCTAFLSLSTRKRRRLKGVREDIWIFPWCHLVVGQEDK